MPTARASLGSRTLGVAILTDEAEEAGLAPVSPGSDIVYEVSSAAGVSLAEGQRVELVLVSDSTHRVDPLDVTRAILDVSLQIAFGPYGVFPMDSPEVPLGLLQVAAWFERSTVR